MIKNINHFKLAWEVIVILLVTTLLIMLSYVPLKDLFINSTFLWFIYFYIPSLIAVSYVILKKRDLLRFSNYKIEVIKWHRYFLFLMIVTGFVFISVSIASTIKMPSVLMYIDRLNIVSKNFSFLFYIKVILLSPIIEEFIFRGIILNGFLTRYSTIKAILFSSLFFSFFHFNLIQILNTFLLGLLCGWYFFKTRNLLSCIIIHSLSNLIGITIIKYSVDKLHYQVITSDTRFFQIDNLWLVILSALSLLIVGFFYLFKSVMEDHSNKNLANDIMEPDVS